VLRIPQEPAARLWKNFVSSLKFGEMKCLEAPAGQKQGEEEKQARYRKGISGDWNNYFSDALVKRFDELTGDLVVRLGLFPGLRC
jgi:hypothetical protein